MSFLSPLPICGKILLRLLCPTGANWMTHCQKTSMMPGCDGTSVLKICVIFIFPGRLLQHHLVAGRSMHTCLLRCVRDCYCYFSKAKLAPLAGHSVSHLELCGAVLATEIGQFISAHLHTLLSTIQYFLDNKIVLGYICNRTRFYTYVSNKVAQIHRVSSPGQWSYVPMHLNHADRATRCSLPDVRDCLNLWLQGPTHLLQLGTQIGDSMPDFHRIAPDVRLAR